MKSRAPRIVASRSGPEVPLLAEGVGVLDPYECTTTGGQGSQIGSFLQAVGQESVKEKRPSVQSDRSAGDPGQVLHETREALLVVLAAPADNLTGLVARIDVGDLAGGISLAGAPLVGQEAVSR